MSIVYREVVRKTKNKPVYRYINPKTKRKVSQKTVDWIQTQYIPHNWDDVYILPKDPKYLAIGWCNDKKCYAYKKDFTNQKSTEKYCRLRSFGKKLPSIKSDVTKMLKSNDDLEQTYALILWFLMNTYIRIGNDKYLKENNTHGLLTLQKNHIKMVGNKVTFEFIGKKSVENTYSVTVSPTVKNVLKKKISSSKNPKNFVFHNNGRKIKPDEINKFIQKKYGEYTAKDFRTWGANIEFINLVRRLKPDLLDTKVNQAKAMKEVVNRVSSKLNNTIAVCKSNYICKDFFTYYKEKPLEFLEWVQNQKNAKAENILLKLLDFYCKSKK